MATRLTDEFPSRTKSPTAAYPDGSYMNETAPGANDGTPLDERIGDDYEGLKQGLLKKAGITPNGQPDSVTNPQQLQAIETLQNSGDSLVAGGNIYPESNDSASTTSPFNQVPVGTSLLKDANKGRLYKLMKDGFPSNASGVITAISFPSDPENGSTVGSATIGGDTVILQLNTIETDAMTFVTPNNAPNDHGLFKPRLPNTPCRNHMEPSGVIEDGTCSKLDWMLDPYDGTDLYPSPDVNYRIFNVFTKTGDTTGLNGENGAAVIGTKNRGDGETWGVFTSMHFGFNDGANVPMKMYYMDTSDTAWRTPMKNFWYETKPVNSGDYLLSGRVLYQAQTTGLCGNIKPVHLSGTVSDGNIDWLFIRNYNTQVSEIDGVVIFGNRDSMPKFGLKGIPVQYAATTAYWAGAAPTFLSSAAPTGLCKAGVRTDAEAWQIEFLASNNRFRVYDNRYWTSGIVKTYETTPTLTNAAISGGALTIPPGVEQVIIDLSSPESISSVSGLTPWQHVTIVMSASSSDLTLVNSALIKTKDGMNLVLSGDTGRRFHVSVGGTKIIEL